MKKKVAIVAGEVINPRSLAMFKSLQDRFETCVFALNSPGFMDRFDCGLKLRLFEELPDMPGYLRGLEDELADFDAIIGVETSRLSTFQAVRVARKYGIPLGVVVNEFVPYFYEKYTNIRAIQYDICNKADIFWATSNLALNSLVIDQVPNESIRRVSPLINDRRFRYQKDRAQSFRKQLGIDPNEVLILFYDHLEKWMSPQVVIDALTFLKKRQDIPDFRLLFVGNGSLAEDLKYRASDGGFAKQTTFLHQDAEPFLVDLFSAADVMIQNQSQCEHYHDEIPMHMLEAMACETVPIVQSGTVAAELAGDGAQAVSGPGSAELALGLIQVLRSPEILTTAKNKAKVWALNHYGSSRVDQDFAEELTLLANQTRRGAKITFSEVVDEIHGLVEGADNQSALDAVRSALGSESLSPAQRSELFSLKGEIYYTMGDFESSTGSFSESMRQDETNFRCYRGLGYLSWRAHSNEEALTFFRKALALQDNDPDTMLGIGMVYRRLGITEEALFWLEKCMIRDDYSRKALIALTQTCMECAIPRTGIEVLERVMQHIGDQPSVLMTLGQLHLSAGNTDLGSELLNKGMLVQAS